jgi:hypothetical protein
MTKAIKSFQHSYTKLSDDIDGLPIDPIEYEYLSLNANDIEDEMDIDDVDGMPVDAEINEDLDGEPI